VSLSPSEGGTVDASTVIEAELRYDVADTEAYPGPYSVVVFFRTERGVSIRPATPEERAANLPTVVELLEPTGRASVRYPLAAVLGQRDLAVPLTLEFVLEDRSGSQAGESNRRLTSPVVPIAEATAEFSIVGREPAN
jgi:hypothetical protein